MPKTKKEESFIEKGMETAKGKIEQAAEQLKDIGESISDSVKEIAGDISGKEKKTAKKKTANKSEEKEENSKSEKLAKLKEKAEKLAGKIKSEDVDLTKKVKGEEEPKDTLAPIEDYLKSSIHLGTRAITPDMKPFVYKRRADSLAVFNTALLDEKLKEAAEYLSKFPPEDIIVTCKREAGWKAIELFSKATGIKSFEKYPPGILTNPALDNFLETELIFICDPWTDKNALADAKRTKIPVLAICDTNNYTMHVDKVIPGNNKSSKSLGFIFYLLAKLYVEKRKIKSEVPPISEWVEGWDNLVPPK